MTLFCGKHGGNTYCILKCIVCYGLEKKDFKILSVRDIATFHEGCRDILAQSLGTRLYSVANMVVSLIVFLNVLFLTVFKKKEFKILRVRDIATFHEGCRDILAQSLGTRL